MRADLFSSANIRLERFRRDVEGPVPRNITLKAYENTQLISLSTKRHPVGTYTRQADQRGQLKQ